MPLASLDIDALVKEKTIARINECDYEQLRSHCLDVKPLKVVVKAVDDVLIKECEEDKKDSQEKLTQVAFDQQQKQDEKEEMADKREEQQDNRLRVQYQEELRALERQIRDEERKHDTLLSDRGRVAQQLLSLNQRVSQLETTHHHHHHHDHQVHGHFSDIHHHGHADPSHHHGHHIVTPHIYGEDLSVLRSERNSLQLRLTALELDLSSTDSQLNRLRLEQKNTVDELSNAIPRREKDRALRTLARQERDHERKKGTMAQLSVKNRQTLQKDIDFCQGKLQQKKEALLEKANEISYGYYIRLLLNGASLTQLGLQKQSLLHIADTMKSYLDEKEKERQERLKKGNALLRVNESNQALQEAKTRLQNLNLFNSQLDTRHTALHKTNRDLLQDIIRRKQVRQRHLLASLFAFLVTALGVGIPSTVLSLATFPIAASIIPFLFIPGGLAGLILVGLLITALVCTLMNRVSWNQFQQNNEEIGRVQQRWRNQSEEITELQDKKIPQSESQLQIDNLSIPEIEKRIQGHMDTAAFYYHKASQIQPMSAVNQENFFATTLLEPSAPPVDELPASEVNLINFVN